jgi:hypothetical protein
VLSDHNEADRLREGGFATVTGTDWQSEASKMAAVFRGLEVVAHGSVASFSEVL